MEAIAYSIPALSESDTVELNPQEKSWIGNRALISAGTGLGELLLVWDKKQKKYHFSPSEGGNTNFSPANELEIELLQYYLQRVDYVGVEYLVSGSGIAKIYQFLKTKYQENLKVRQQLDQVQADEHPAIISH